MRIWKQGCIIRSALLDVIRDAYLENPDLPNLLLDKNIIEAVRDRYRSFHNIVRLSAFFGVPTPAFSASISYFNSYRSSQLPANLIQAQRDYFGAHTYERVDKPRGEFFHTNWTGRGGTTAASTYNV